MVIYASMLYIYQSIGHTSEPLLFILYYILYKKNYINGFIV